MSFDGFYISIHSLRMEGDISIKNMTANYPYFNPLPPYGGRLNAYLPINTETGISIHSLRMEGDYIYYTPSQNRSISIHSLRMEGDRSKVSVLLPVMPFQSTPSVWRET